VLLPLRKAHSLEFDKVIGQAMEIEEVAPARFPRGAPLAMLRSVSMFRCLVRYSEHRGFAAQVQPLVRSVHVIETVADLVDAVAAGRSSAVWRGHTGAGTDAPVDVPYDEYEDEHPVVLNPVAFTPLSPPSRTDWTRLIPPPVLTGHVSGRSGGRTPTTTTRRSGGAPRR
jgi:hypothetical protein